MRAGLGGGDPAVTSARSPKELPFRLRADGTKPCGYCLATYRPGHPRFCPECVHSFEEDNGE